MQQADSLIRAPIMKKFLLVLLSAGVLIGCSRSDKADTTVKPQSTPDAERLKSDSERLQQATANAAKEREKTARSKTPAPKSEAGDASPGLGKGPRKGGSPMTVPPMPAGTAP
jgi:hypothetical protein